MAWPPPTQKLDWDNADVQLDAHPGAHNDIAATLANDYQPQIANNITDIATNASEIAAHNVLYSPSGTINVANPRIQSDAPVSRLNAAGTLYSYLDGIRSPVGVYNASLGTIPNSGSYVNSTSGGLSIDIADTAQDFYVLVTARMYATVQPGAAGNVSIGQRYNNPDPNNGVGFSRVGTDTARGSFRVSASGVVSYLNVATIAEVFFVTVEGNTSVQFGCMARQTSGANGDTVEIESCATAIPFWR